MQKRIKALAAAAFVAVAGAAHADLTPMSTENSSLVFVALDNVGTPISLLVDLNYSLNDFLPTSVINQPGTTISWNFLNNSLSVNGVAQAGNFAWSSEFATFMTTAQSADLKWGVYAGDTAAGLRFLTTGNPTQTNINAQTLASSSSMGVVDNLFAANAGLGTHATSTAGASTASSGAAYLGTYGNTGQWNGTSLKWTSFAADASSNEFEFINVQPRPGATTLAQVTTYGNPNVDNAPGSGDTLSLFSFNSATGTLTWTTSPVPEPTSLALFAAGLAAVGFVGRRRRA